MTKHGEFNWHELQTRDARKAMAFYRETIGWTFHPEKMPTGDTYWLIMASGRPVGGILTLTDAEVLPERWVTYIHVENIDSRVTRAKDNGATVLREPWDVAGVGRVAMLREPGGAEVGWVTPIAAETPPTK